MNRIIRVLDWLSAACLLAAVAVLPLTSFPLLSRLMGGTLVAPPAIVFVALGLACWLPGALVRDDRLPGELAALAAFALVALVSTLLAFFSPPPAYKGISQAGESLSALLTLTIGLAVYLFFAVLPRSADMLRRALQMVDIGGLAIIIWSAVQLYVIFFRDNAYPAGLLRFHDALSIRSLLTFGYMHRATGFAYEPSWLAHQLNILYLPWWLGASLAGYSAFRRIGRLSLENLLLAGGLVIAFFSLSRIGYLTLMLMLAYLVYRAGSGLAGRIADRIGRPGRKGWVMAGLLAGFVLFAALSLFLLAQADRRVAAVFAQNYLTGSWFQILNNLQLAERFAYWGLGWNVFAHAPLLGVGLGNTGFYFESGLPQIGWWLHELLKLYYESGALVNPKNLWIRLLAETGAAGFTLFITWLAVLFSSTSPLRQADNRMFRALGWAGALSLVALVGEGFSIDSFAMPYSWAALGLLTAVSLLARRSSAHE